MNSFKIINKIKKNKLRMIILNCIFIISIIICFLLYNYERKTIIIKKLKYYNNNIFQQKEKNINEKQKQLVYFKTGLYNYENKDLKSALENYESILRSKYIKSIYRDFSKLMTIKIKILIKIIDIKEGIDLYNHYYQNSKYFQNIAILSESILFINMKEKQLDKTKLNTIITNNETSNLLLYITKILVKRLL